MEVYDSSNNDLNPYFPGAVGPVDSMASITPLPSDMVTTMSSDMVTMPTSMAPLTSMSTGFDFGAIAQHNEYGTEAWVG